MKAMKRAGETALAVVATLALGCAAHTRPRTVVAAQQVVVAPCDHHEDAAYDALLEVRVTDPANATIPGVTVTARLGNASRTFITDRDGLARVGTAAGSLTLNLDLTGFVSVTVPNLVATKGCKTSLVVPLPVVWSKHDCEGNRGLPCL
jgi:hypothetical protein